MRLFLPLALLLAALLAVSGPGRAEGAPDAQPVPPLSPVPGASPSASEVPAFSVAQRAEIVTVLRDALRTDPSILRDALAAVQADDERRRDSAQADVLGLLAPQLVDPADPFAGQAQAPVTVVEFYDTRCPYCRRMMATTDELVRTDPGVRVVFKDLPVLGPASKMESLALLAAHRQNGYLRLQAAVMRDSQPPTRDTLKAEAVRQGLDGAALLRDMDDPILQARLDANIALAQQIGIQGTPTLIVGTKLLPGAVSLAELQAAVAEARRQPAAHL